MTISKTFKKAVKIHMKETGEPYSVARKFVLENGSHRNLGIPIGKDEANDKVYWNPQVCSHLLIGGKPVSGKTYFLNHLIKEMQGGGNNLIAFIDLKGMEYNSVNNLWRSVNDIDSGKKTILEAEAVMEERYKDMQVTGILNYRQLPNAPTIFVIIDEFNSFFPNKDLDPEDVAILKPLLNILMLGRAAGIHLIITIQESSAIFSEIDLHIDARLALGVMSDNLYEIITYLEPTEVPLVTEKRFGEGTLRLHNWVGRLVISEVSIK